jgi:[ribosomal protein S18]-alanine N-acetyltransferase
LTPALLERTAMGWELATRLTFRPMDLAAAQSILGWCYAPPYDFYNPRGAPSGEDAALLADPRSGYYAIYGLHDELVAYCCFGLDGQVPGGDYSAEALDIGMQLRPDLTGHGQGRDLARAVLKHGRAVHCPARFRVTVAEFNRRALRVWEQAGFERTQTFARDPGGTRFVILTRSA